MKYFRLLLILPAFVATMASAQTSTSSTFAPKQASGKDLVQIKEGPYTIMVKKSDLLGEFSDKSWSEKLQNLLQTQTSFTTEELNAQMVSWSTTEDRFAGMKYTLVDFMEHNEVLIFHGTRPVKNITKNVDYENDCRMTSYLDEAGQRITELSLCVEKSK